MNYIEQVAKMLGVEIWEEFSTDENPNEILRFSDKGLEVWNNYDKEWGHSYAYFGLVEGHWSILKKPWKPKMDEIYFISNPEDPVAKSGQRKWKNRAVDKMYYRIGNCYQTRIEAVRDWEKWERFYGDDSRIEWEGME